MVNKQNLENLKNLNTEMFKWNRGFGNLENIGDLDVRGIVVNVKVLMYF